jgi:aryl-alcohol dehydrogenase-like predicted oxidoreductase
MQYRTLGRSNIQVSVICQGCWSLVGADATWGGTPRQQAVAAIRASLDAGVNFFDTAEGYNQGESEEILASALAGRRQHAVIASKASPENAEPAKLKAACEASLRRLHTDYIDLYQLHWPSPAVPIADTLAALEDLRQAGKIRLAGVSNFGASCLNDLLAVGRVESNQLCYSLLFRPIEHAVQPLCAANGISILCYSPLCQGLLTGKFPTADSVPEGRARSRLFSRTRPCARHAEPGCESETFAALSEIRRLGSAAGLSMTHASLAWLLARPAVASVIAGARSASQARDNALAADITLPPTLASGLTAATEPVKAHLGPNADFWQSDSRMERSSS